MHRADNLITFMCRMSGNFEASTSWNPQGLSRFVSGLLYLHNQIRVIIIIIIIIISSSIIIIFNRVITLWQWLFYEYKNMKK